MHGEKIALRHEANGGFRMSGKLAHIWRKSPVRRIPYFKGL
jgi:hypothetical protein